MVAFKEAGGEAGQKRKERKAAKEEKAANKAKKEANADKPKKPAGGAYGIFLAKSRADIVKSLPNGSKVTEVSKVAAERFKALGAKEKAKYEEELKAWKASKGEAAEEDADDEDVEDDGDADD